MKLDKDTLVKHQFWLLLGIYALVWIVAVFWLKVAADEPIKKAEKDYTSSKTKHDSASKNPRNPDVFCPPWQEYSKDIDKHKQNIWNEAWNFQKGMYDWPEDLRNQEHVHSSDRTHSGRARATKTTSTPMRSRLASLRRRGYQERLCRITRSGGTQGRL